MANMSYCRFTNTLEDLKDCIEAIENREISSSEEKQAAVEMINTFLAFMENECIIEGFDKAQVKDIIESCD